MGAVRQARCVSRAEVLGKRRLFCDLVKWIENSFENGRPARSERWTGILTVVIRQPTSVTVLRKNPLGIYVHGLDWSREITSGEMQ